MLIKEYDFDNSVIRGTVSEIAPAQNIVRLDKPNLSFVDTTHQEGEKPIYTVACVCAPNAPKPYPNMFVKVDAFQDCIKASGYDRIKVLLDPDHYKLTRYKKSLGVNQVSAGDITATAVQQITEEVDLQLLAIDPNKFRYKMHLINVDNQKDAVVNIKLTNYASPSAFSGDVSEDAFEVSAVNFSDKNISFQYGIE